jgi:hypothetical protein
MTKFGRGAPLGRRPMRCPSCGFENPEGMNFCGRCGTQLSPRCPHCDFENPLGFAFCGKCGASLAEPTPAAHPPALTSPLQRLQTATPAHLAEKILTSCSALEGERKQVTVLFADLKGSMELLADRDPEDARQLLDPVLARMMEAVHRYEGTVNQVMGDGIMALFGAPIAHEDHAVRACYAALHMQEVIGRYAETLRRQQGLDVQIRPEPVEVYEPLRAGPMAAARGHPEITTVPIRESSQPHQRQIGDHTTR